MWINQQAWFSMGDLSNGWEGSYQLKVKTSGVYAFVIEGNVEIAGIALNKRDGLGITETENFDIKATSDARILLMEVPMR
jgi:quercetin 2,3-dioxygenase